MKNAAKKAVLASAIAIACGSVQAQNEYDDRWYVSGFGGVAELDDNRAGVENDAVFGFGFGRFFSEHVSFELELDRIESDLTPPAGFFGEEYNAKSLGIFGRYHFRGEDKLVRPYLGIGAGATYRQSFDVGGISGDKDTAFYFSPVAGLSFKISDNFGARLQAAWRSDVGNDTAIGQNRYDDFLFTAGITYKFGDLPEPPPPPPAPAPAPPPPPVDGDDDNDGVLNSKDKCPNTRPGAVVDMDGCEVQVIIDLPGVNFAFDEARLTDESYAILDDAVTTLKRHRQVKIEVAGHTDSVGTESYNLSLSDRRAAVVRDYLISQGIAADRMTSSGYGESRPVATNDTSDGRARNRRTELVITSR